VVVQRLSVVGKRCIFYWLLVNDDAVEIAIISDDDRLHSAHELRRGKELAKMLVELAVIDSDCTLRHVCTSERDERRPCLADDALDIGGRARFEVVSVEQLDTVNVQRICERSPQITKVFHVITDPSQ
jgi:hypothetical protein